MLAYLPHTMSRKRRGLSFTPSDCLYTPATKRSRGDNITRHNKDMSGEGMKEDRSLDFVVLPRPTRSRRMASLKAQLAVSCMLNAENPRSPSPHGSSTEEDDEEEIVIVDNRQPASQSNSTGKLLRQSSGFKREDVYGRCISSLSPLSSLGSEWDEEKAVEFHLNDLPPKMKNPVLALVPVVECKKAPVAVKAKKPAPPQQQSSLNGYVRRMASLNARACVSAMMEPLRRPSKPKAVSSSASMPTSQAAKFPSSDQIVNAPTPRRVSPRISPVPVPVPDIAIPSRQSSEEREQEITCSSPAAPTSSKKYVAACELQETLAENSITQNSDTGSEDSEVDPFNAEGLLWNGDTLHPQSRVYLTPDGVMPRLIVSPVRPTKPCSVLTAKIHAKSRHPKKQKKSTSVKQRDNGWAVLGNPIKTVLFPQEDGTKVSRKYYIGMRRKNEELYARDCITVKSGKKKQDTPFIAKIGSIWRDGEGDLAVTLFWYYRPEEATGIQTKDFQEDELLASQHYDNNSVACIEDRCFVLGSRQYCRYHALRKSAEEGIQNRSDSFAIAQDSRSEMAELGLDPTQAKQNSEKLVFLCYRGYNHIAGKLLGTTNKH